MRLAIAAYQNRIAAILESADRLIILESPVQVNSKTLVIQLNRQSIDTLLNLLQQQGVSLLVCGAVSGWTQQFFEANGIQVSCWMTGEVNQIIEAFATDNFNLPRFLMPGCRGRFRRHHGHPSNWQATEILKNTIKKGEHRMKISITATSPDLTAIIDPRFGRAQYFIIIDSETMAFEAIPNPALQAAHGAGIQAAQLLHDKGVTHLITGSVGPNAMQTLSAGNIKIFQANQGSVQDAVAALKNNELSEITQAGPAHAGTRGGGMGSGMSSGRGMGGGGGRGMGGGGGRGMGGGGGRGRN